MKHKGKKAAPVAKPMPVALPAWIRQVGFLVALLAALQYIQTVTYEFVLDDYSAIIENTVTRGGIESIPTIFKTSYRFGYPLQGDELYRPLPKAIFAVFWSLAPDQPLPGHLFNILLYSATGFFLWMVLYRYFPGHLYLNFFATVFFIVHPVHTEVVSNIKSADELLGFLFFIISLLFLQRYLQKRKAWMLLASLMFFFCALLSKESSVTFLAIYPLLLYFNGKEKTGSIVSVTLWMSLPVVVFLLIRNRVVGTAFHEPSFADNVLMHADGFLQQKASAVYFLGYYLKLLMIPFPLRFDYSYNQLPVVEVTDWKFLFSMFVLLALLIVAAWRLPRKDPLAFGILFFFITISVSSNLFVIIGTHMAERLLYVPSFGFCFAVAALLERRLVTGTAPMGTVSSFFRNGRQWVYLTSGVVIIFGILTWMQTPLWKSNLRLFESGVHRSPGSHRTHYYLGNYLVKKANYSRLPEEQQESSIRRGLAELRETLRILPGFADACLQIGNYYSGIKRNDSALHYFTKTLEIEPGLATAHNNLGTVYFELKHYDQAIEAFRNAVHYDPNYMHAYRNLGSVYGTMGRFDEAVRLFKQALQLAPNDAECNYYMGITYRSLGNEPQARVYLERAAALDAKFAD